MLNLRALIVTFVFFLGTPVFAISDFCGLMIDTSKSIEALVSVASATRDKSVNSTVALNTRAMLEKLLYDIYSVKTLSEYESKRNTAKQCSDYYNINIFRNYEQMDVAARILFSAKEDYTLSFDKSMETLNSVDYFVQKVALHAFEKRYKTQEAEEESIKNYVKFRARRIVWDILNNL